MDTQLSDIIGDLLRQMEALLAQPSKSALETLYVTAQRLEEETEKNNAYPGLSNAAFSFSVFLSTFSGRSNLPDDRQLEKLRKLSRDIGDYLKEADRARTRYSTLLYFGDPELLPFGIHDLCAERGIRLSLIDDVFSLTHALESATALNLLVDLRAKNKLQPFLDTFARRAEAAPISLSVVSIEDDADARMEAERLGAMRFFSTPLIASELLNVLFPDEAAIPSPPAPRRTPDASPRVIIVDDDESQAEFAAAILANAGMHTLAISDPAEVLAMAGEFVPDLILIDLYMPEISGEELTVMLRGKPEYRDIPLIYLSGELEKGKQDAALTAGANGFLEKPIRPKKLINTVKETLESRADIPAPSDEAISSRSEPGILEQIARHTSEQRERQPGLLSLALHVELGSDTPVDPAAIDKLTASLNTRLRDRGLLLPAGDNILRGVIHGKDIEGVMLIANNLHGILLAAFGPARQVPTTRVARSGLHLLEDPHDTRVWEYAAAASQASDGRRCILHADTRQRLVEEQLDLLNRHVLARKPVGLRLREIRQAGSSPSVCAFLADASFPETRQWRGASVAYADLPPESRLQLDRDLFSSALDKLRTLHQGGHTAYLLVPQSARVIEVPGQRGWLRDALRIKQQVGSGLACLFPVSALNQDLQQSRAYLDMLKDAGIGASAFDVGLHTTVFQIADYLDLRHLILSPKALQEDVFKIKSFFDRGRNSDIQLVLPYTENSATLSQLVGADCYITDKYLDPGQ